MKIGIIIKSVGPEIERKIEEAAALGFKVCQINGFDSSLFTDEMADRIVAALNKHGMELSAFWCGWRGPQEWNFYGGYKTLGLVPPEYRADRVADLLLGSDFAYKLGAKNMVTHVGFIPENPNDPEFDAVVDAVRDVAQRCKDNGQRFLFETGQETPVTLLRTFEAVGLDNLGVNLDPANFILYGKANPGDALDTIGKYVYDVHAKDGLYPTDGKSLGKETRIGEGKVDFPRFIARLRELGYDGPLTIEREISGEQQIRDIIAAKKYLEELIAK